MNVKAVLSGTVIILLAFGAVMAGRMFGEVIKSEPKVEFTGTGYTYIGEVNTNKLVRINDTEKNVACYILGGHRGVSCVSLK